MLPAIQGSSANFKPGCHAGGVGVKLNCRTVEHWCTSSAEWIASSRERVAADCDVVISTLGAELGRANTAAATRGRAYKRRLNRLRAPGCVRVH